MHNLPLRRLLLAMLPMLSGPALGAGLAERALELSNRLQQIAASGEVSAAALFSAAAPFGFSEMAAYEADFSPSIPPVGATQPVGVMLPLALLLDAAFAGSSVEAMDSLNKAQPDDSSAAIYFEQGPVFLEDLRTALEPIGKATGAGNSLTVSVPVVLSASAALVLRPGDELVLDRAAGAFVVAAGGLIIDRALVAATEATNGDVDAFRPFVLANAAGLVEISAATFRGLGYGQDPRMAGLAIAGTNANNDYRAFVQDSRFVNTGSLSLVQATRITVQHNLFDNTLATAIAVVESAGVVVDGNAVLQSASGHGIKVGPGVQDVLVSDNIVVASAKHGILVEDSADSALVFNNLVLDSHASGIAVLDGSCLVIEQNITMGNAADGIMVRRGAGLTLEANYIAENLRAGVSVAASIGVNDLSGNNFIGNRVGLRADAAYELHLEGNDWSGQAPRLLDGDIEQFSVQLLNGITSGQVVRMFEAAATAVGAIPGRIEQVCGNGGHV